MSGRIQRLNERAVQRARWNPEAAEPVVILCERCGLVTDTCECPKCTAGCDGGLKADCKHTTCVGCGRHDIDCECEEAA